ncbi:thiaminase II/PqqC family protein [Actinocorallia populi]|uniref:transcriptional regulator n=1 Tax=Actinocorallia populi TaxID=2079200 RepID=UPI000D0959B3|nr:transcriptional regulator [Actinocorallia populi]
MSEDFFAGELVRQARDDIATRPDENRFVELLESGELPRERLNWLAGEEFRIVRSDQRSFALLASRFPDGSAGDLFLGLAQGEAQASSLLLDFSTALGWGEKELNEYAPLPFAQVYPAYLAWCAVYGTRSAVALAMIANLDEWGGYCGRVADALTSRYGLAEEAVGFFRFFATPPPGFAQQAEAAVVEGLDAGEDPVEALRAAQALHVYEAAFWDSLVTGLE